MVTVSTYAVLLSHATQRNATLSAYGNVALRVRNGHLRDRTCKHYLLILHINLFGFYFNFIYIGYLHVRG